MGGGQAQEAGRDERVEIRVDQIYTNFKLPVNEWKLVRGKAERCEEA